MTAVLAVLRPEYLRILDPDVCGGRAPGMWCQDFGWRRGVCAELRDLDWRLNDYIEALVLYDSRDPVIGRRGLAAAADAVAKTLGWSEQVCSPAWECGLSAICGLAVVFLRSHDADGNILSSSTYGAGALPDIIALHDRIRAGVTPEVLALAVGAVLAHLGIAERIEEVTT
jgi:hypothetical protein